MSGKSIKILLVVLLLAGASIFFWSIGSLVRLLIVSAMIAYLLDPVANALEARGLSRLAATAILFGAMAFVILAFGSFTIPAAIHQLQALQTKASADQTTQVVNQVETLIEQKFSFLGIGHIDLAGKIEALKVRLSEEVLNYLLTDALSLLTHLVAMPFIIFFLIKDGREMKNGLLRLAPNRYFEFTLNLLYKMDLQLGYYLRGQFLDAAIFGMLSTTALWILNVKYFMFIGIFAGLANLIPYVGPIAGGALATAVTVFTTGDFVRVAYVILAFAIVKLVDDSLIQPMVVARSVDMHPLLVLFVVIIGGQFFGILGMLLSVPVAGFIKVVVRESIIMVQRYRMIY